MKKHLPFVLCSILAFAPGAVFAATFVSPRVPAHASAAKPLDATPPPLARALVLVTTTADDGPGSLRQAIATASAGDTVAFALALPATIVLSNTIDIAKDLTVLGPGPDLLTVMRNPAANTPSFRVFSIDTGVVLLAGITIRNGRAINPNGMIDNLGGAILNWGTLTVSNCVITGNTAPTEFGGHGFGGGIFSGGPLTVLDSTISGNEASWAGGGLCTFHAGLFVARQSTISDNFAGLQGGGVNYQEGVGRMENCTISGNATPTNATASGLLNICFGNEGALLTLDACTITRNFGSTVAAFTIAALTNNLGLTNRLLSTLVADNSGPNFFLDGNPVFESLGHNLDSDGSSGLINGANGDLVGTAAAPIDARLGPLQDNGGLTLTHALLPRSPALDMGACTDPDGAPLLTDQRGFPRPQGAGCDIGAFENQPPMVSCPPAQTLECTSPVGAVASLQATVADPDGDALVVLWSADGAPYLTNFVAATHPPASATVTLNAVLGLGTHSVTVLVSDGKAASVACSTSLTVQDTTPPRILAVRASPNILWPPNGKLMPVRITVSARDTGGSVTSRIVSVSSNEPLDRKFPDWIITGNLTLLLRAERLGRGHGRVYTITVESRDPSGNTSTGIVRVTVPHSPASLR